MKFLMVFELCENEGEEYPGHNESTGEETKDCYERLELEITQSHDGVTGSAAARVTRAESNQKSTAYHKQDGLPIAHGSPAEQFSRVLSCEVGNSEFFETLNRGIAECDGSVRKQELTGQETPDQDAEYEHQVPGFTPPVVLQEFDVVGNNSGAHVAKRGTDTKGSVEKDQVQRHHEADDGPGYIPRPRLANPIDEF